MKSSTKRGITLWKKTDLTCTKHGCTEWLRSPSSRHRGVNEREIDKKKVSIACKKSHEPL